MLTMNVRHDCGCVKKAFPAGYSPPKSSGVKTRRPRISHSELTLFTRQLATLSAAALPLEESLAVIGQQSSNKRLADVLNQVRSAILEGHPLSDALQHFPTLFDSLYRTW